MRRSSNKGFTLVELLVAIAIIGILVVVAVPELFKNIEKAKIADMEAEYSAYKSACLQYYAEYGELPNHNTAPGSVGDLNDYLENQIIDGFGKGTPIGGYYWIAINREYQHNGNIYNDLNRDLYKIDINGNRIGGTVKLKDEGDIFLVILSSKGGSNESKSINISKDGLSKLVKDLGEGNVYELNQEIALKIK